MSSSSSYTSYRSGRRDADEPDSLPLSYSIINKYSGSSSSSSHTSGASSSYTHTRSNAAAPSKHTYADSHVNGSHSVPSSASSRYSAAEQREDDDEQPDSSSIDNAESRRGEVIGSRTGRYLSTARGDATNATSAYTTSASSAPPATTTFFPTHQPSFNSLSSSSLHSESSTSSYNGLPSYLLDGRSNRLFNSRTPAAPTSSTLSPTSTSSSALSTSTIQPLLPTASSDKVPTLVRALVVDILSKQQQSTTPPSNARIDALRSYCLRLLSSRLTSSYSTASPPLTAVQDTVHSAIAAISPEEGTYAAELLQRFARREGIRDKARVLQLLLACKDTAAETSRSAHDSFALSIATSAFPIAQPFNQQQAAPPKDDHSRDRHREQLTTLPTNNSKKVTERTAESDSLSDAELVRDLLYTFQAIDGRHLHFHTASLSYRFTTSAQQLVSPPRQRLVARLSQIGALYKLVCGYINSALERGSLAEKERARQSITAVYGHHSSHPPPTPSRHAALLSTQPPAFSASASASSSSASSAAASLLRPIGLIEQSFVASLQSEMTNYLRWVSVIEAQHLQSPDDLTLHRLWLAVQQPLSRLITLATLSGAATTLHGGALLTCLANARQHGSSTVQSLTTKLLHASCAPLFQLIQHWLQQGDIHDVHSEFFIAVDQSVPAVRLWSDKYRLRRSMLPGFIPLSVAEQILVVGKSVNFIRQCCQDAAWHANSALDINALLSATAITDTSSLSSLSSSSSPLSRAVSASASLTNAHLLSLMLDKYHFLRHARALKSYLLMSAGDFIEQLLSQLHSELHKPGAALNPRHLTFLLDQAVRASNARFEPPDVLHRLSIKLHRPPPASATAASPSGDDSGWEAFTLDYLIDSPLNVIITPGCIAVYLRVFSVLWRLKRVEWELKDVWMRQSSHRCAIEERLLGVAAGGGVYAGMRRLMAGGYELRQTMWHLLSNLSSYFMFQVMESSWRTFEAQVKAAREMDDLIAAHRTYVQQISDKALLTGVAAPLSTLLLPLFDDILRFTHTQQVLYDEAMHECTKRQTYTLTKQPHSGNHNKPAALSAEASRRTSLDDGGASLTAAHIRGRSVSAAEAYAATSGALMDSGVFVGMLPRWQDEMDRQRQSFYQHINQLLLALDAAIEKGHTNIRAQQQQQHDDAQQPLTDVMQTPARTSVVEGKRPVGQTSTQRPASSAAYMGELEFLRLRLDFNNYYTNARPQQQLAANAPSQHTTSNHTTRVDSTPVNPHRTNSALRTTSASNHTTASSSSSSSSSAAASGFSVRSTARAVGGVTGSGADGARVAGRPPRPRQLMSSKSSRTQQASGDTDEEEAA